MLFWPESTDSPSSKSKDCSKQSLIDLLDGWATTAGHTTLRHFTTATCSLVNLHHDWVHDTLKLLLLVFKLLLLCKLILVQPVESLLHGLLDFVLIVALELVLQLLLLQGVAHREAVVLQAILCLNLGLCLLVFGTIFLSFLHHAINFSLRETTLLVRDGDLVGLTCRLVLRTYIQDAVCIDVEGNFDLWDSTRGRWDVVEVELAQHVVVLGHGTLALEDLNQDTGLVIGIGSEGLRFLGGNRCVSFDKLCHPPAGSLQAHGQRSDIQKQEVLHLRRTFPCEDSCLNGCTKRDRLIGVD